MKKDILTLLDLSKNDFDHLFQRARELKAGYRKGVCEKTLAGKTLGLVFDKPSTRTRISLEAAMVQLGGTPIFMSAQDTQMVRNEPIMDTGRVLSRYLDALAIRTFSQDLLTEFAKFTTIPVINALTDRYHPCQVLSDLMTIIEYRGGYAGVKITWVGDGNNVCHSWINAAAVLGLNLVLGCPEEYFPDPDILKRARQTGCGNIEVTTDPVAAAEGADVIYTDVWASMGQESESLSRKKKFAPYQVNSSLIDVASKDVLVMHCLPVHRGEEISDEVFEGPRSIVWDQAENKMHLHKAVLETLIGPTHNEKGLIR
ncbi:MAG: ornithine carbamoyltransferase [Desulfobacterales bacterium]|nr:ornithine carbamoyltransferase [Desulfobacterales bacterium]